ncbi:MAG TPA: glycosyl hydrolase family 28-related protein [Pyrinomonadaceae bacterium]|nr:glycosyl hydrolase family 28-related protein [Pyrinomonadaceae bacterium]
MKMRRTFGTVISGLSLLVVFQLFGTHSKVYSGEFHHGVQVNRNPSTTFDPKSFGAKGDGKALDTPAINKAIDAAAAASGGTVWITAGTYRSFSIRLKSNVTLYLDQGAIIVAADPHDGDGKYDAPEPNQWDQYQDFGHSHWHNSLIWGENLENISILGPGRIWGKGLVRSGNQSRTKEQNDALGNSDSDPRSGPFGYPNPRDAVESGWGNKSISLKLCRNVIIRDVTILHGGHFAILATGVDNLTIDNVKIDTNRDGMDVDACKNVRISNCTVNSPFDDGICPKSSFALGYSRVTENLTIANCQVSGYDEGTLLDGTYKRDYMNQNGTFSPTGRIKLGTESNGGFKNVAITNCVFDYSRGLALEAVDGAWLEDVAISNITMRDVSNSPIFIRLGSRNRGPKDTIRPGAIRRVMISNVVVFNADPRYSSIISGIPGVAIEDVTLQNIRIYSQGGGTREQASREPPEKEDTYPEPSMFGDLPAYGFFFRHVKGLQMRDIQVKFLKPDSRPAFWLNNVTDAEFFQVKANRESDSPIFQLKNVSNFALLQSWPFSDQRLERVDLKKF